MKTTPPAPHDIRRVIFNQVARYRLTVIDALRSLPSLSHVPDGILRGHLNALVEQNRLQRAILHSTRPYYYSNQNGRSPDACRAQRGAFSEQAKIRCYTMLAFCRLTNTPRIRLFPSELSAVCPELSRPGLPRNYYADETQESTRLGYAYLDTGGRGRWDRIVERLRHCIDFHRGLPQLGPLVDDGQFEFAVVTTFSQKADRIHDALKSKGDLRGVAIRVCVIPELLYLIAPPRPLPYTRRMNGD